MQKNFVLNQIGVKLALQTTTMTHTTSKPKTTESQLCDDENPRFLFTMTFTTLLLQIAEGKIDARELAKKELANRGLGKKGEWVGFDKAAELHQVKK